MQKSILRLESSDHNPTVFRTFFKTRHGRSLYLSVKINGADCMITDCFYIDRNQGRKGAARYSARPKKLRTRIFPTDDLLKIIEAELDKHFYGVEFLTSVQAGLSLDEYLQHKADSAREKYRFLIMVGEGGNCNGLPVRLRTRLKTKLHRSVFVELAYYKDGKGVV